MSEYPRPRSAGFTVVELLIIMVVISLISVVMLPIFLDTLETAKQKRTMSDIVQVGQAMMAWTTDQFAASAAGIATVPIEDYGPVLARDEIQALLVPDYLKAVVEFDAWGRPIEYRLNIADLSSNRLMAVRSAGRDGTFSGNDYKPGPFDPRAFNEDLVWVEGSFIRWPQRE